MDSSNLQGSCAVDTSSVEGANLISDSARHTSSFGELFKALRKQLVGKQACLSRAGLRCTDAAISHWERGLRLPRPKTMRNVIGVLEDLGAAPTDIAQLKAAWSAECLERKVETQKRLGLANPAFDG
jgi:hypothetical protein